MVGIPGQTYEDLAGDILTFNSLGLHMIGVGPWISHPATPLATASADHPDQAPNTELMTYKMIALARLACPGANIPATTALATLNTHSGRELGLARGANIVMPNLTPARYRALYEIYPGKACVSETARAMQRLPEAQNRIDRPDNRLGTWGFALLFGENERGFIDCEDINAGYNHENDARHICQGLYKRRLSQRPGRFSTPARSLVREVIAKSLEKHPLSVEETAVLLAASDPDSIDEIFEAARELKQRVYGNRIVIFAPLYRRQRMCQRLRLLRIPAHQPRGRASHPEP